MTVNNEEPTIIVSPCAELDSIISKIHGKSSTVSDLKRIQDQVQSCLITISNNQVVEHQQLEEEFLSMLRQHSVPNMDTVAACLLRLLPEPSMNWLSDHPWRPVLVNLFDAQFIGSIYAEKGISIDLMGHEKLERLTKVVEEYEKYLQEGLQLLTSLDRAGAQRQRLMQALNSRLGRVIFRPFLPPDIESLLSEIYEQTQDYLSHRNDADIVDVAVEFTGVIDHLVNDLNSFGTIYAQMIKEQVCEKLLHFVELDLSENKAAEPTEVIITAANRKYPLEDIGSSLNIELIVNNKGPGSAYEVVLSGLVKVWLCKNMKSKLGECCQEQAN